MFVSQHSDGFGRDVVCVALFGVMAVATRAGDIVGRAFDVNTGSYLAGVAIEVVGRDLATVTGSDGQYRLLNVPSGPQQVRASYLGYDLATTSVTVPASGDITADLSLGGEIQRLSAITVEGYREGRSRALQQKQTAANIMDIVSADSVGNLPDRNVAEAVARLPGVNLSLDQGEGRYVSIRGAEPNLNQVMMDGATMAAPGGSRLGRAVPLDTLGAGQISSIEVIKSVTPDMDANAIGGSLNIKSTSAFDHKGRFLVGSVSGSRNGNTNKNDAAGQVTYSDTFGAGDKWGLAASVSYDRHSYQNEWLQIGGWSNVTIGGNSLYLPNDFEVKPEWGYKERGGANLNIEYRPDVDTQFYLRPGFSRIANPETRFEIIYTANTAASNLTLTSPHSGTYNAGNRSERRAFRYRTDQDLRNLATGFKKVMGAFTIEPMLTFSRAGEKRPYTTDREFRNANGATGPINFDLGTGFVPVSWVVDPTIDTPSKYPLRRTRDDFGWVTEKIYTAKTDVRYDASDFLGHAGYLKAGIKFLERDRLSDFESRRLVPAGTWNLGQTGDQLPSVPVYDGRFQSLFLPNIAAIDRFIAANPALVTHDLTGEFQNSHEDNYRINEYIYSAYAMGGLKIERLNLLAGVRWEKTDATIRAIEERTVGSAVPIGIPTSGTKHYDKLFPNLQGVYHFTAEVQLRAAFTQTIGRPAYEDSRSLYIFTYSPVVGAPNPQFANTGSLTIGNPELKPYSARSYDLSLEWYAKKTRSVITIAAFRKEVSDPIYTFNETRQNTTYSGVGLQTLAVSEKLNGTSGRISGLEFSVYQPLSFLPSPLDGFGIEANFTAITSSETIPTRPGEAIPFFRQPNKIRNFTLFYEKYGFAGRIAYSYSGEQIYTLGSSPINDRYETARGQYDAQISYRLTRNYSITASCRNFTRVSDEMSYGIKNLVQMSRLLDRDYKIALNFNF